MKSIELFINRIKDLKRKDVCYIIGVLFLVLTIVPIFLASGYAVLSADDFSAMKSIREEMRSTFDSWSAKFETRMDNKVDNIVTRIDNLSDKYGGVKSTGASAPSISVVNAPNK